MPLQFAHLHSHTDHSPLDGHATMNNLANEVERLGQPGFASTDHGVMSNVYNGWKIAKEKGLNYLPGIEAYVAPGDTDQSVWEPVFFSSGSRDNKEERSNDVSGGGAYTHLTMLAETSEGMHNLFRLNTLAFQKGNYRKQRMDINTISQMSAGIIATTGCPSGELQTRLRLGQWKEAIAYASKMQDIFGKDNYFLELMDHNMSIDLERKVRADLMKVSQELNIPLLATNDLHYVRREDAKDHEHMLALQSGSTMSEPSYDLGGKRFAFEGEEYYAKSVDEMLRLFPEETYPGAISNTVAIVDRARATFEYNPNLRPSVPLPEGHTEDSYLRQEAYEGLARKRPDKVNDPEYVERLEKELNVFLVKNFSGYMLVVSDFMRWAKAQGWECGPARGCLSADTNVLTSFGFKKINEIQVGDQVFDQLGNLATVPKTFEYDCDEELLAITSYYGGSPIKMTADHKVLVSKADRELTKSQKTRGYKYGKNINSVEWVRADQVELGDFVVTPKINFPNTLSDFDIETTSTRQVNDTQEYSCRTIAKKLGLARSTVVKFMKSNGQILGEKSQAIHDYLLFNNVTIEDIVASRTITTILPIESKIAANSDMGKLIGLFLSDGWLRTRGTEIGFAQRRSEDDGTIPNLFKKIFGIELAYNDHATADLRQYYSAHKGIIKLFRNLFPEYKQTAHTKYLPAQLLHSSEEFRRGLLEGLWYGDGSHKGHTSYSTVSKGLAEGVFSLLISLGLQAGLKKDIRKKEIRPEFNKYDKENSTEYRVTSIREFDTNRIHNGMGTAFDGEYMYQRVRNIETVPAEGKVYDFTMPTTNSYVTDSFVVHNSGGGSLLAFCTDITEIDPIPHGLIFERFLNPERDSPPDIDSDFDDVNREKVIDYVRQKYGEETVAMIITFGMIKAKSAIKDIARIFDEPYATGETLTKMLPPAVSGKEVALHEIFDKSHKRYVEGEAFRELANLSENKRIVDAALGIEGKMRSTGVHAAGVIMSSKPLKDSIPLMMRKSDGVMISQFDYPTGEALGLIKMDFLGIRNLTVIDKAIKAIHRNHGVLLNSFEIYDSVLTTHDEKTYDLLRKGLTLGVFQLDSPPIAALLKSIAPDKFGDLSATIALYRPGPMGMNSHNEYADRKNGRKPVVPIHPELEKALESIVGETYGIIAYQEQVMAIAQKLAGYTMGEADNLRRAMGKKKKSVLDAEFPMFETGMKNNGYSDDAITTIWETLIPFAEYGFNKSHSAGYGLISYITAYLKANYPAEFMAANLSTLTGDKDKTALYLEDCRHLGLDVAPPSVSFSTADYTAVDGGKILVGLEAIRGVGHDVSNAIAVEAQTNGAYKSLDDFLDRAPVHALSKGVIEGLAWAGALDGFGYSRRTLKENLPELARSFVKVKKKEDNGQFSLFDEVDDSALAIDLPELPEYTKKDKLAFERHALGLYVSDHPLSGITRTLDKYADTKIIDILSGQVKASQNFGERKKVTLAGVANSITRKPTKKGEMFAMFSFEDVTGTIPCLMFPKTFARLGDKLAADSIYKITGTLLQREGEEEVSFSVDQLDEIEVTDEGLIPYVLNLYSNQVNDASMTDLNNIIAAHPGDMPVYININDGKSIRIFKLDESKNVENNKLFHREVMTLFGTGAV